MERNSAIVDAETDTATRNIYRSCFVPEASPSQSGAKASDTKYAHLSRSPLSLS
jgi:hypothetical protein